MLVQKKEEVYTFPKSKGLARRVELRDFAIFIGRKLGFKVSADNIKSMREIPGGIHLDLNSALPTSGNFISKFDGSSRITLSSGTLHGITPTLNGLRLDELDEDGLPPAITYNGTGTIRGWFKITTPLSAEHGYVYHHEFSTVIIESGTDVPADNLTSGIYYRHIFTYVNGVKTAQNYSLSLDGEVTDDGTVSSQGVLRLGSS